MITQVQTLLILSIIFISSGCICLKKHPILPPQPIIIHQKFESCPAPVAPNYVEIDNKSHIGSKENLDTLIENMLKDKHYTNSLENCIKCYENQVKEDK